MIYSIMWVTIFACIAYLVLREKVKGDIGNDYMDNEEYIKLSFIIRCIAGLVAILFFIHKVDDIFIVSDKVYISSVIVNIFILIFLITLILNDFYAEKSHKLKKSLGYSYIYDIDYQKLIIKKKVIKGICIISIVIPFFIPSPSILEENEQVYSSPPTTQENTNNIQYNAKGEVKEKEEKNNEIKTEDTYIDENGEERVIFNIGDKDESQNTKQSKSKENINNELQKFADDIADESLIYSNMFEEQWNASFPLNAKTYVILESLTSNMSNGYWAINEIKIPDGLTQEEEEKLSKAKDNLSSACSMRRSLAEDAIEIIEDNDISNLSSIEDKKMQSYALEAQGLIYLQEVVHAHGLEIQQKTD